MAFVHLKALKSITHRIFLGDFKQKKTFRVFCFNRYDMIWGLNKKKARAFIYELGKGQKLTD